MSGNLTDLMTPEQARMMYAALRERLPQGADQPIDVTAPLEFLSVSARQPNAPVTQGIAATAQAPADADLPVPPPQMAPPAAPAAPAEAGAAPSPTVPQGEADALARLRELVGSREGRPSEGELARDALSNFFFSMAASRNPSFFGQLGEAGQTFSTAARQARQDARQERQTDVEAAYRAASEARQQAELAWAQDPTNPRNIALLAQARAQELNARTAAAGAGRERLGQGVQIETPNGPAVWYPSSNEVRPVPGGGRFMRTAEQEGRAQEREDARYLQARAVAQRELASNPAFAVMPEAQQEPLIRRRTEVILSARPGATRSAPTEGAPTPTSNAPRYDAFGNPITQ